jgi:hypothetical protein
MPKAIQADWELLKARYIVGASPKQLADEFGVSLVALRRRIVRGRWVRLRTGVKEDVSQAVEKTLISLRAKSERVKERLADELVRQTEALEHVPSKKNLKALSARSAIASTMATTSEKVFGWSHESDGETIVNVLQISNSVTTNRRSVPQDNGTAGPQDSAIDAQVLPESEQDGSI